MLQLLLLPLYLWLFSDAELRVVFAPAEIWPAFLVVLLPAVFAATVAFLRVSLMIAKALASPARLDLAHGRTLAFSTGTRNSFIVLPFALALPAGWEAVAVVVVLQFLSHARPSAPRWLSRWSSGSPRG